MHEGVSSPGILNGGGGGAKNSDLLTSEVRKTSLKGMTMKLGCAAYLELP